MCASQTLDISATRPTNVTNHPAATRDCPFETPDFAARGE
jgi:hypothetical protein